jgi:protein transport protein SEC24
MLVVSDVEDVFLPLPDDMLVNLKDSRSVVDTLLGRLLSLSLSLLSLSLSACCSL